MKCANCNHNNESDAKFCTKCGEKIDEQKTTEKEGSVDRYFKDKKHSLIKEAEALAEGEMRQGIVWFIIALAITGGTWLFASEGGTYFILWGPMIYGIYRLIRGFGYKMNPESLLEKAEKEADKENQNKK